MEIPNWKRFGLGFVLTAAVALSASGAEAPAKRATPERLHEIRATIVDAKVGGPVQLQVWGRTEQGHSVYRKHPLPPEFRVEETPFDTVRADTENGACELHHRILYRAGDRDVIAGWIRYYGKPGPPEVCWSCLGGELTNVRWGFDLDKQRVWVAIHPEEMPVLPAPFLGTEWRGLRVGIPLDLERVARTTALEALSRRGATIVTPGSPADVVLLPDDIDFIQTRNGDAEAWIRGGARVLSERAFETVLEQHLAD